MDAKRKNQQACSINIVGWPLKVRDNSRRCDVHSQMGAHQRFRNSEKERTPRAPQ